MIYKRILVLLTTVMISFLALHFQLVAGGFLAISSINKPYTWNVAQFPIKYHLDQGNCGLLSNATMSQLVQNNIAKWTTSQIRYSSVQFSNGGSLSSDIKTAEEFEQIRLAQDGKNPIVYDVDGSIIEALGMPPGVIGFASPVYVTNTGFIIKGIAVFNGNFLDGDPQDGYEMNTTEFGAIILHEFGHFLNLDHTQINGHHFINDTDPGFQLYGTPPVSSISIMFPLALGLGEPTIPQADDIRAISELYPTSAYTAETKSISGRVFMTDGVSPLTGANVIARNNADPFMDVASNVSGALTSEDPNDPDVAGFYTIPGLKSGANYTIEVVNINAEFDESSSVGPLDTPVALNSPEEFYNSGNESNDGLTDDPTSWTLVQAGTENVNIHLNAAITSVNDANLQASEVPATLQLYANFPNPFNPETAISFYVPKGQRVKLFIYDILGREIRKLIDENIAAGLKSTIWDGRDNFGNTVAGGVYIYKILSEDAVKSRKLLLLK
ncbi:MAG: T9SS C-terminal target domain-containing protein [Calditrichaeota bacterium]|nr:MAG: T9SS C-terminal target domain-containing protein [Calditrichota bacterium]